MSARADQLEMPGAFRHEALLYDGEDDLVEWATSFVRDGLTREEPTLVVVSARRIARLKRELGPRADGVFFADMARLGHNPARIIPAWQEFVATYTGPGVRLRGIGEPVVPGQGPEELVECQRHESFLNLAFAEAGAFWLVCPYDTSVLPREVIEEARRSHPVVTRGNSPERSPAYHGLEAASALLGTPLPRPPADAVELQFDSGTLERVRQAISDHAVGAGLEMSRRVQLVVAVNEIASNSIAHGGGHGIMRVWSEHGRIVCEIQDEGRIEDPLIDRTIPAVDNLNGRGLWIANQLCDLVQVRSLPAGAVVRLHLVI